MKKFLIAAALLVSMSGVAHASIDTTYTYTPGTNPNTITDGHPTPGAYNLFNLDHNSYYKWGIDLGNINLSNVSNNITAASITFSNIQNWDTNSYALYLELLDSAPLGVNTQSDASNPSGNAFGADNSTQIKLKKYITGIPYSNQTAADVTWDFTPTQLAKLYDYAKPGTASAGVIGLGFDPDCHFWNTGVTFSITTSTGGPPGGPGAVPEPATMLLFGTGLAGLAGLRMRRKKN